MTLNLPTQVPQEARIDIRREDLSLVVFTSNLLEFIMFTAGATEIRAGEDRRSGKYVITCGKETFAEDSRNEAYRSFLGWLMEKKPAYTEAEAEEHAREVEAQEAADSNEVIALLTEDGMSDFGKTVQNYRSNRGKVLAEEILRIELTSNLPEDVTTLHETLSANPELPDLGVDEVIEALKHHLRPISPAECRAARALIRWSQSDLGKAAFTATSTVADFEREARDPILSNLRGMRRALEKEGIRFNVAADAEQVSTVS